MKSICILILLSIAHISVAIAQKDEHPRQTIKVLDSLKQVYIYNPQQRKSLEKGWREEAYKTGNNELLAFAKMMTFVDRLTKNPQLMESFRSETETNYKEYPNLQAIGYRIVAYHYFIGDINYEKAFDVYLKLEKLLDIYGPEVITDYANYCSEIASAYYKFRNYKKAIEMDKRGVTYARNKWDFYNTIGLCFKEMHQLDSSVYYLRKAVVVAVSNKLNDVYRTISLGNIGYNYYLQGNFRDAKPLIALDLSGALAIDDAGLAAGAAIPLADIYLSERKWNMADSLLQQARQYISRCGQLDRLEKLFTVRSRYHQMMGQAQLALAYRDSLIASVRRNDSVFNGLLVMRVQQRSDMEKMAEEKNKLENYKKISQTRMWAMLAVFSLIVIVLLVIRYYRKQVQNEKKQIEELRRIMELRQRLSADMHDDVGSTLSSISLYSHSLLMQPQAIANKDILEKIKQNAQNVQESISDIIWSVNPDMDTMDQVIARMRAFGADVTEHAGISLTFISNDEAGTLQLDMDVRRNIFLIYKEAINNAVKYSRAKQISVLLKKYGKNFVLEIIDDGCGFDTGIKHMGNGLVNMRRRADEMNAILILTSGTETGTKVSLTFPE